jgi:hypothetical protein
MKNITVHPNPVGSSIVTIGICVAAILSGCASTKPDVREQDKESVAPRLVDITTLTPEDLWHLNAALQINRAERSVSKTSKASDQIKAKLGHMFTDVWQKDEILRRTGSTSEETNRVYRNRYDEVMSNEVEKWRNVLFTYKGRFNDDCNRYLNAEINPKIYKGDALDFTTGFDLIRPAKGMVKVYFSGWTPPGPAAYSYRPTDAFSISRKEAPFGSVVVKSEVELPMRAPIAIDVFRKLIEGKVSRKEDRTICITGNLDLALIAEIEDASPSGSVGKFKFIVKHQRFYDSVVK